MPSSVIEIAEKYQTIVRPSILQICKDIKSSTVMKGDTEIIYTGYSNQKINYGSSMGETPHQEVDFGHKNYLMVDSDISYQDPSYFNGQPHLSINPPIIHDEKHDIKLFPIYNTLDVKLSFRYVTEDRVAAMQWETDIRRRMGLSVVGSLHRLEYSYPVNGKHIEVISYLYSLLDPSDGIVDPFNEWLNKYAREQLTILTDQGGGQLQLAVSQIQLGVQGQWDADRTLKVDKIRDGDRFSIAFNYSFQFDIPNLLVLRYPIYIDNQVIDEEYRRDCDYYEPLVLGNPGIYKWGLDRVIPMAIDKYPTELHIIPCYDEWRVENAPRRTSSLYTALIIVDIENPTYVMNLMELDEGYELVDWVIELLKIFHDKLNYPGHSPFLAMIYRGNYWLCSDKYFVDENLDMYTTEIMIPDRIYHSRLAVFTDLTLLSEHCIDELISHGKEANKLLTFLSDGNARELPRVSSTNSISKRDFYEYVWKLRDTHPMYKNGVDVKWLRVSNCVLSVDRMEHADLQK